MLAALAAALTVAAPGAAAADARVTCAQHGEPSPPGPFADSGTFRAWTAQVASARLQVLADTAPIGQAPERLGTRRVYGWKTPFALTAGADVVVTIVRGGGRFQYTRPKTWGAAPSSVRFTACAANEPLFGADGTVGPITGWPGGLYTTRASTCLRLRVASARGGASERAVTLTVPLGRKRC